MPRVDFNEEDAFALLAALRDRVRRNGFVAADESAIREALADDADDIPSERRRLLIYLDHISAYIKRNSQEAYREVLRRLNAELGTGSEKILGVYLESPEGTGLYPAGKRLSLDELVLSNAAVRDFLGYFDALRELVKDGSLRDRPGPNPNNP